MGACVTSLDMAGVSLTLMACDDARLAALDAPTAAPGWPAAGGPVGPRPKAPLPLPAPVLEQRRRREQLLAGRPLAAASPEGRAIDAAVRCAAHWGRRPGGEFRGGWGGVGGGGGHQRTQR
jgi:dihydroxyacetone kinase